MLVSCVSTLKAGCRSLNFELDIWMSIKMIRPSLMRLTSLVGNLSVPKLSKNSVLRSLPKIAVQTLSVNNNIIRCHSSLPSAIHNENKPENQNSGKMQIIFTCTVCNTRNNRMFSKLSYEKGIVIVECDGCGSNHLIADNLGWFPDTGCKNIEEILDSKGEKVKRINGCWEITSD